MLYSMMVKIMFAIRFSNGAGKFLQKLDRTTKERIKKSLLELAENPYEVKSLDVKRLAGYEDSYLLRVQSINSEKCYSFIGLKYDKKDM